MKKTILTICGLLSLGSACCLLPSCNKGKSEPDGSFPGSETGVSVPVSTLRTHNNGNSINTDVDEEDKVRSLQVISDGTAFTSKTYYTTEVQTATASITLFPFTGTRNAWFVANLPNTPAYTTAGMSTERVLSLSYIRPPFVMTCHYSFLALVKNTTPGFRLENQIPYNTTVLPGIIQNRSVSRLDLTVLPEGAVGANTTDGIRVDKVEVLNVPKYIELAAKASGTQNYLSPAEIAAAPAAARDNFIRSNESAAYPAAGATWSWPFTRIYLPENVAVNQETETKVKVTMSKRSAPTDKKAFILSVGERQGAGSMRIGRNRYYNVTVTVKGWQYLSFSAAYSVEPWDEKTIDLPAFE